MTIITGKHRELLIEMLLYYLETQRKNYFKYTATIEDIRKQNWVGDYWIKEFIDNTK